MDSRCVVYDCYFHVSNGRTSSPAGVCRWGKHVHHIRFFPWGKCILHAVAHEQLRRPENPILEIICFCYCSKIHSRKNVALDHGLLSTLQLSNISRSHQLLSHLPETNSWMSLTTTTYNEAHGLNITLHFWSTMCVGMIQARKVKDLLYDPPS